MNTANVDSPKKGFNKRAVIGVIFATAANVIFGFSFLFTSVALDTGASPLVLVAVRFTVAFAALNLLWLFGLVKIKLRGKAILPVILMGLCQPLLYFIFETYGIKMVSSAISGVIISLVPVAVIVIETLVLKNKPTFKQAVFAAVSVAGAIIVSIISGSGESKFSYIGAAALFAAVLCAAGFNILSSFGAKEFSAPERTYIMFAVGTAGFNLLCLCVLRGGYFSELKNCLTNTSFTLPMLYLAVISSVVAFLCYNYSTAALGAVRAAAFSGIIPVCSVLAGIILLHEKVDIYQLLCCAAIIIGVYGVNRCAPVKNGAENSHNIN